MTLLLLLMSCQVQYEIVGRRSGDVDTVYADPSLALRELNWKANKGLKEMCKLPITVVAPLSCLCTCDFT